MAQQPARPHTLTYHLKREDGSFEVIGPITYESRGECERQRHAERVRYGEAWQCSFIDPLKEGQL